MKSIFLPMVLIVSSFASAQVESVEMLPEVINKTGTANTEPSFNARQDRLLFYRETKSERTLMISEKSANGVWSEPRAAVKFPNKSKGFLFGAKMNAAGTRIYFGWKSDIYFSEHIGDHNWADALRIDEPISTAMQEDRPSITEDEQTIAFIRNAQKQNQGDWIPTPFISNRNKVTGWSEPKQVVVENLTEPIEEILITQNKNTILFATATQTAYHNYYATLKDSSYAGMKEINFSGGKIRWISADFSTGLAETFTNPRKIVKVNFTKGWIKTGTPDPVALAAREVSTIAGEGTSVKPAGKYYGLFIGVSNYTNPSLTLDRPVKDASTLSDLLTSKYKFEKENVKILANPTRQEILSELFRLRSILTPNDNLLIFFAGHGYWDKHVSQGYWWPKDAQPNDPSFWLSNSDLREQIRGIQSGHTLLISDACFSGGIFKARGGEEAMPMNILILYKTKSRRAITSGNMSTVPDQSVFFDYLSSRLNENAETYLPAQHLFNSLKVAVINNSMNIPQEGVINDSGDEGGDFIFIKR